MVSEMQIYIDGNKSKWYSFSRNQKETIHLFDLAQKYEYFDILLYEYLVVEEKSYCLKERSIQCIRGDLIKMCVTA